MYQINDSRAAGFGKSFSPAKRPGACRLTDIARNRHIKADCRKVQGRDAHSVLVKKTPLPLTSTEFKLLVELASKRGRVLTRNHLLERVWGYTYEGYARTVDTHIRRLREKLAPLGDQIETIRGVGYRFREDPE